VRLSLRLETSLSPIPRGWNQRRSLERENEDEEKKPSGPCVAFDHSGSEVRNLRGGLPAGIQAPGKPMRSMM